MRSVEEWRAIEGYEGIYEVSNLGRVKALSRTVIYPDKRKDYTRPEQILKPWFESGGYYQVSLCKNGKVKNRRVHVLVAMAFLGHIPNGSTLVVDHIDENRTNNNIQNLQIITHQDNIKRSKK